MKKFIILAMLAVASTAYTEDATKDHTRNSPAQATTTMFTNESGIVASTPFDLGFVSTKHTWSMAFSGSPASVSINLQCTNDGTNYYNLDTYTNISSTMRHVVNKPCREVRGNIGTLDTGSVTIKTLHIGD